MCVSEYIIIFYENAANFLISINDMKKRNSLGMKSLIRKNYNYITTFMVNKNEFHVMR